MANNTYGDQIFLQMIIQWDSVQKCFSWVAVRSHLIKRGQYTNQLYVLIQPGAVGQQNMIENIAKGTTDPRVEFISQDQSSQFTNLEHTRISESRLSINFKISTKHQHLNLI